MWWFKLIAGLFFWGAALANKSQCDLPVVLVDEIKRYQPFVDRLVKETTTGNYSGRLFDDLTAFVDRFGPRFTGTNILERSIQYLGKYLSEQGLKTKLDPVTLPVWRRGKEVAFVKTKLRKRRIKILALGFSSSGNVTGPLLVVNDFEELEKEAKAVPGKIVLFNAPFTTYEETVAYRMKGPSRARKLGAVGALVRSVTPFSIGSTHAGMTDFQSDDEKITAAAISLEAADMLGRLYKSYRSKNETVIIIMTITPPSKGQTNKTSYNLISDISGSSEPQSYVTMSGHVDSWDVGQGALDDGGGAFLAIHSLLLLKTMKVAPPKRTLRSILWTSEEMGLIGAKLYAEGHKEELKNWTAAFESDEGLYRLLGLNVVGNPEAVCILQEIAKLFSSLNATQVVKTDSAGSDITVFKSFGFVTMEPRMVENNYFWFHHTDGDSMRTLDPKVMDQHLALLTGTAYILGNLTIPLPKEEETVKSLLQKSNGVAKTESNMKQTVKQTNKLRRSRFERQ